MNKCIFKRALRDTLYYNERRADARRYKVSRNEPPDRPNGRVNARQTA